MTSKSTYQTYKYIIGIDDSGRGNWLGSLVVAGFAAPAWMEAQLKSIGVRDCKELTLHQIAYRIYNLINLPSTFYSFRLRTPPDINQSFRNKINLNQLEALMSDEVTSELVSIIGYENILEVRINNADPTEQKFLSRLSDDTVLKRLAIEGKVVLGHDNDKTDIFVAAASMIARFIHETEYAYLKLAIGDFGKGFDYDERTFSFVTELYNSGYTDEDMEYLLRKNYRSFKKVKQLKLNIKNL